MKLQDLLKDIELGKVYTDKDRKPFKVNEETLNEFNKSHFLNLIKKEIDADEFKALLRWKQSVNHAMWIAYTALMGILVKIIFF